MSSLHISALSQKKDMIRLRAALIKGIRSFFDRQGFLEVDTPILVRCPGMEPQITAFETTFEAQTRYLHTSPEYAMKRLLAAGYTKIFQLCKTFRDEPIGKMHNPEFTMLEWYRAGADYTDIMHDTEHLIASLATDLFQSPTLHYSNHTIDLTPPWTRLSVCNALIQYAQISANPFTQTELFIRQARERGHTQVNQTDSADIAFFKVFLDSVEKQLGTRKPTFLIDYPASMAALAKRQKKAPHLAERFELYIAGLELANAFTELTDPDEQRARFHEEQEQRRTENSPVYPMDKMFLGALQDGMPPSGGIALGVDRLLMLFGQVSSIQDVIAFTFPTL
jgi:lysyl-tRNA synthetase class 2